MGTKARKFDRAAHKAEVIGGSRPVSVATAPWKPTAPLTIALCLRRFRSSISYCIGGMLQFDNPLGVGFDRRILKEERDRQLDTESFQNTYNDLNHL